MKETEGINYGLCDMILILVSLSLRCILCAMLPPAVKNKELIAVETPMQTKGDLSDF